MKGNRLAYRWYRSLFSKDERDTYSMDTCLHNREGEDRERTEVRRRIAVGWQPNRRSEFRTILVWRTPTAACTLFAIRRTRFTFQIAVKMCRATRKVCPCDRQGEQPCVWTESIWNLDDDSEEILIKRNWGIFFFYSTFVRKISFVPFFQVNLLTMS